MQWIALFKKEIIESFRNKKWIWLPLVLTLLAIMDPITNYYLPQILNTVGGLPEGTQFSLPEISAIDAFMMSLSQLSSLGVLVIALSSMGTIAGERKTGLLELTFAKPVSSLNFITSKWAALVTIVWASYLPAMALTWYYIGILYDFIPIQEFLLVTIFYGVWLTFVATLSIFYNAFVHSPGLVAFLTIGTLLLMSLVTNLFMEKFDFSPNNISSHAHEMLITNQIPFELYGSVITTIILCITLLIFSIYIFRIKEHA